METCCSCEDVGLVASHFSDAVVMISGTVVVGESSLIIIFLYGFCRGDEEWYFYADDFSISDFCRLRSGRERKKRVEDIH
jgi:hypothetical protein